MVAPLSSPEKELRFTRSAQAVFFWIAASVLITAALVLWGSVFYRAENPQLPSSWWALIPLALSVPCIRLGIRLARHAYLILTPMGIEIFPFFRPVEGMQMVYWQEIHSADLNPAQTLLSLHYNAEKTAGLHLSLRPIRADRRSLLAKAVIGRLSPPASQG